MNVDVLLLILCGLGIGIALMVQDIKKTSNNWKRYTTTQKEFEKIQDHLNREDDENKSDS